MKVRNLSFMNVVAENGKEWFINECWNTVFRMDRNTFEVEFFDFPKLCFGKGNQYKWIAKWGQRIICVSNQSNMPVYIIDDLKKHTTIAMPMEKGDSKYIVHGILQNDKYLYFFTDCERFAVIEFHMETGKFVRYLDWDSCFIGMEKIPLHWGDVVHYKGSIWSAIVGTDCMVEIICEAFETVIHRNVIDIQYTWAFGIEDDFYYALVKQGEKDNYIIREGLICENMKHEMFRLTPYTEKRKISNLKIEKDTAWLFPGDDGNILKVNLLEGTCKELKYPENFLWIKDPRYMAGIRFTCIESRENTWVLYPRTGNGILRIDKVADKIEYFPLNIRMDDIYKIQGKSVDGKNLTEMVDNLEFLKIFMDDRESSELDPVGKMKNGLNIYKRTKALF